MKISVRQVLNMQHKLLPVVLNLSYGLVLAGCSLFWRSEAEEVASDFPVYPGAVLSGSYDTSWPDDSPRVALAYSTEATVQELSDFYQIEPTKQGWQLNEVIDHNDPAATIKLLLENEDWNCRVLIYNEEPRRIEIEISPK